jgi:hypothetical protein
MSSSYSNYLANTTFKATSFGSVSGLGTSARTTAAVLLGGPRAGAGSAFRIYSYLVNHDQKTLALYKSKIQAIVQKNAYFINQFNRNYRLALI